MADLAAPETFPETFPESSEDKRPGPRRYRMSLASRRRLTTVVVAALTGAVAAGVVARATGWGEQTVVERTVVGNRPVAQQPADIPSILAAVLPSVVSISATSTASNPFFGDATAVAGGTGIVVSADGEVLTNAHVVSDASSVTVTLNGTATALPATILGSDSTHDLALLKVQGVRDLSPATWADSTQAVVGDGVVAVGYALSLSGAPSVTAGILSAVDRDVSTQTANRQPITLAAMLQTDAAISSGDSGGPLVDSAGHVLGVNTTVASSSRSTAANNIGFAVSSATVEAVLPSLRGRSS